MSPLSWSFLRRCSWFDGGLSIDCVGVTPAGGAALRVADACRSEDDVAGGEGIVSMSCFELAPLRKGFRDGRPRFSGDDGLSMPFEPLPCRPRTVPSRLKPPKLLFAGGGPVGRLVIFPKHTLRHHLPDPDLVELENGLGASPWLSSRACNGAVAEPLIGG